MAHKGTYDWIYSRSSSFCLIPNRFYVQPLRKCMHLNFLERLIFWKSNSVHGRQSLELRVKATWGVYPRIPRVLCRHTFIPVNRRWSFFLCPLAHFQHRSSSNALCCLESDWAVRKSRWFWLGLEAHDSVQYRAQLIPKVCAPVLSVQVLFLMECNSPVQRQKSLTSSSSQLPS